ncbi:hypothetical protein ACVWZA_000871 [Sphingomonas sp. UYAg733]
MNHEMMGCEYDEIGGAPLENVSQIPDFEAPPGRDKQHRVPDMAALTHQRRQGHHAVRRDQRRFDKAIIPAQAMCIGRDIARLSIKLALHRIATIKRNKALCVLMQADEKHLIQRAEPDGFHEATRQRDITSAGHIAHGAAEKELVHSNPHCHHTTWLTEPVRVAEFR